MDRRSTVSRNGVVNRHNSHHWSQDNPHWLRQVAHQVNWRRMNVWCCIHIGSIIGPVFYDGTLGGIRYRDIILEGVVLDYFEDLPLAIAQHTWFQLDGAPAHSSHIARQFIERLFQDKWIGKHGPVPWQSRHQTSHH